MIFLIKKLNKILELLVLDAMVESGRGCAPGWTSGVDDHGNTGKLNHEITKRQSEDQKSPFYSKKSEFSSRSKKKNVSTQSSLNHAKSRKSFLTGGRQPTF